MSTDRTAVTDLIYQSGVLLDEEKYSDWLKLCRADFRYRITAYSHEIRKEMVWLEHDLPGLDARFTDIPNHVVYWGKYRRHVGMCEEIERVNGRAMMESSVIVYHTDLKGDSSLFAVVKYRDAVTVDGDKPLLADREVQLDTRFLPFSPTTIL